MKSIKGAELTASNGNTKRISFRFSYDRRTLYTVAAYVLVCCALLYPSYSGAPLRVGDIAKKDYTSPATTYYIDTAATTRTRTEAALRTGQVFRILPSLNTDLEALFKSLSSVQESKDAAAAQNLAEKLKRQGISTEIVSFILSLNKEEIMTRLRLDVYAILRRISENGVLNNDLLMHLDDTIDEAARENELPEKYLPAVKEIIKVNLTRNLEVDKEANRRLAAEASQHATPVKRMVKADEIIVRRGDRITQQQIDMLKALGMGKAIIPHFRLWGLCLFVAIVFLLIGAVLKNFSKKVYHDEKLLAIFLILIVFFLILIVFTGILATLFSVYSFGYLIAASVGAMSLLICFVLDPLLVVFTGPMISGVVVMTMGLQLRHFLLAVVVSFVAYIFASRRRQEDALLRAGVAVGISGIITIFALTLIYFENFRQSFVDVLLFGSINGIISFVVAMGLMPAFEKVFNITTPHRLLELCNPAQPLLKRLLVEAPGTYHHSIFVGNLAEMAAEFIGADALLARAAAYYHDIGKLKRSYFFTENQLISSNQLSGVSPTLGALVISSHVKDGIDIAHEYNLPPEIVQIIPEHHGTNLISFFYQEAKDEAAKGDEISKDRYRYPGPKPQSLEAAIIMLADSCEASVRSLKEPTPKHIEAQVNSIVKTRLVDGQFDECNITLKQIDTIRATFIQSLTRMYHARLEYPELKEDIYDKHRTPDERPDL